MQNCDISSFKKLRISRWQQQSVKSTVWPFKHQALCNCTGHMHKLSLWEQHDELVKTPFQAGRRKWKERTWGDRGGDEGSVYKGYVGQSWLKSPSFSRAPLGQSVSGAWVSPLDPVSSEVNNMLFLAWLSYMGCSSVGIRWRLPFPSSQHIAVGFGWVTVEMSMWLRAMVWSSFHLLLIGNSPFSIPRC